MSTHRALAYRTLSRGLSAGLPLDASLDLLSSVATGGPAGIARGWATWSGGSAVDRFAERLTMPGEERKLLVAAEECGRLPEMLDRVAGRLEKRSARRRRLLVGLIYPTILVHVFVVTLHAPKIVASPLGFLSDAVASLTQLWLVLALTTGPMVWLTRSAGGRRRLLDLGAQFPLIGRGLRQRAAADYADQFSLHLATGRPLFTALESAAAGTLWTPLRRAGQQVLQRVRGGASLTEAFLAQSLIPRELTAAVRAGEPSGRLEETVEAAAGILEEAADRRATAIAIGVPATIYLGVVLSLAWFIISAFANLATLTRTIVG